MVVVGCMLGTMLLFAEQRIYARNTQQHKSQDQTDEQTGSDRLDDCEWRVLERDGHVGAMY